MNKITVVCIASVFLLGCSTQEINIRFLDTGYAKEQLLKKTMRIVPPGSVEVLSFNEAFDRMFHGKPDYSRLVTDSLKLQLDTLRLYGAITVDTNAALAAAVNGPGSDSAAVKEAFRSGGGDYIVNVKYVKIANRMDLVRAAPSAGAAPGGTNHCIVGMQFELWDCAKMKKMFEVEITDEEGVVLLFTGTAIQTATIKVLKDFAEYLNKNL